MTNRSSERYSPSYLVERRVSSDTIYYNQILWAKCLPNAVDKYLKSLNHRSLPQSLIDGIKKLRPNEDPVGHVLEGIQFAYELDLHHKRANGLRAALITNNANPNLLSPFGLNLTYAMNHSDFTDHGIPHVRRLHAVMDQIILRVPELRHSESIMRWLPSLELFPHYHDMDQVMTMYRNKEFKRLGIDKKLEPKAAHGLAAAVMTMALYKRYNEESGMTRTDLTRSKEICKAAALMMVKHEEPDKINKALSAFDENGNGKMLGTDARYDKRINSGTWLTNLVWDFDANMVDMFSLSPSQLIEILRQKKAQKGFVDLESPIGLDPQFEREYSKELAELSIDNDSLIPEISAEQRKSFTLATNVAVFADEVEMIYPPYPSIVRSLKTDVSKKRSWWNSQATVDSMLKAFTEQGGNLAKTSDLASDSYRLLWESWNIMEKTRKAKEHDVKEFHLETTPYVNNIAGEHVLMRLMAVHDFGEKIMNGKGLAKLLGGIYNQRNNALSRKYYSRIKGLSTDAFANLSEQYRYRMRLLTEELTELTQILENKPSVREYNNQDTQNFILLCDKLIEQACNIYNISSQKAQKIRRKMLKGREFYKTYDPLGGLPDLIREPEHYDIWVKLLGGYLKGQDFRDMRDKAIEEENAIYL